MQDGTPALRWFKSSFSGGSESECVEAAFHPSGEGTFVRDSKDPSGSVLLFSVDAWNSFITGARRGEFGEYGSG